jgi:hypothetical protein
MRHAPEGSRDRGSSATAEAGATRSKENKTAPCSQRSQVLAWSLPLCCVLLERRSTWLEFDTNNRRVMQRRLATPWRTHRRPTQRLADTLDPNPRRSHDVVDDKTWQSAYRVVACVSTQGAPLETRGTFVVEDGDPVAKPA